MTKSAMRPDLASKFHVQGRKGRVEVSTLLPGMDKTGTMADKQTQTESGAAQGDNESHKGSASDKTWKGRKGNGRN